MRWRVGVVASWLLLVWLVPLVVWVWCAGDGPSRDVALVVVVPLVAVAAGGVGVGIGRGSRGGERS